MQPKKRVKLDSPPPAQEKFFQKFRQSLRPGLGMAEELSDLLGISIDSAYRRIRGETELTIDEAYRITRKYPLSIDDVFGEGGDSVTFSYTPLTNSAEHFSQYLKRILQHLKQMNACSEKKLYYVAEEMPLFYSFCSPIFTDFKLFYWQRSVLNCPEYQVPVYTRGLVPPALVEVAHQCYSEYLTIPSVEVWTDLTVLTGLRQIGFYYDTGVVDKETALVLLGEYRKTIELVQRTAEDGRKNPSDASETYRMYSSDLVLGTNCIFIIAEGTTLSFISFNTLNSLGTPNAAFNAETEHWMRNLEKKSTLISGIASKQRYQFFSSMFRKIDEQIERTKNS